MATLKETPKKSRSLANSASVDDVKVREAFDMTNNALKELQDMDYNEVFLELMNTPQFKAIFNTNVWKFINKNFVEEQMVRDAAAETSDFKLASKKYFVLPTDIPRNRMLDIDLDTALSQSNVANGLGNGYFKILQLENNQFQIVDGNDITRANCGYVIEDNLAVPVPVSSAFSITQDGAVYLRLSDKEFTVLNIPAEITNDLSGLRLIGRIYIDDESVFTVVQERVGFINNNFSSEAFDVMMTGEDSITMKGGNFGVDENLRSVADTGFSVIATGFVYISTDEAGPATVSFGTPGVFDPLIAVTPIAKVYVSSGKITRIEQFIRGWFHCHTSLDSYKGFFKVIKNGSNYDVIDGSDSTLSVCGYVKAGNTRTSVSKASGIVAATDGAFYIETTYTSSYQVSINFNATFPDAVNGTDICLIAALVDGVLYQRLYGEHNIIRWV